MTIIVRNRATRELIGQDIVLAQNFWQKFVGLMGTRSLTPGAGMLLSQTNAVHGFFMRYSVRLVYLDKTKTIVAISLLHPWRIGPLVPKARWVLELPDGISLQGLHLGDQLEWDSGLA